MSRLAGDKGLQLGDDEGLRALSACLMDTLHEAMLDADCEEFFDAVSERVLGQLYIAVDLASLAAEGLAQWSFQLMADEHGGVRNRVVWHKTGKQRPAEAS